METRCSHLLQRGGRCISVFHSLSFHRGRHSIQDSTPDLPPDCLYSADQYHAGESRRAGSCVESRCRDTRGRGRLGAARSTDCPGCSDSRCVYPRSDFHLSVVERARSGKQRCAGSPERIPLSCRLRKG